LIEIKVQKISEIQGERFFALSRGDRTFKKAVEELWERGVSKPEWCFVLEKEGKVLGRLGFLSASEKTGKFKLFGLILPGEKENQKAAELLLKDSLRAMEKAGAREVIYQLHFEAGSFPEKEARLLKKAGMDERQIKLSFFLQVADFKPLEKNRLQFRAVREVGTPFYIDLIAEVTRGTFDREDLSAVERLGAQRAAEEYFSTLQKIDPSLENWLAGFQEDRAVGLVIPQILSPGLGAINYIGVGPHFRGCGYSKDLLDRGIKNLLERDVQEVIADIDEKNLPMEKALQNTGFVERRKIMLFSCSL